MRNIIIFICWECRPDVYKRQVITCIVNSINCVWVAVAGLLVPDFIYNIGTTVLNGGVSMVIFFFVNKIIFPEDVYKRQVLHDL